MLWSKSTVHFQLAAVSVTKYVSENSIEIEVVFSRKKVVVVLTKKKSSL